MAEYTITYFPIRARAEISRLVAVAGKLNYKNQFVAFGDSWAQLKPQLPFGQLPLLTVKDAQGNETLKIVQSIAMARYLARKAGFYGQNDEQDALQDQYIDGIVDWRDALFKVFFGTPKEQREEALKEFFKADGKNAFFVSKFAGFLKTNGGKHLVGDSLTLVDLFLYDFLTQTDNADGGDETLKAFIASIEAIPEIKTYVTSTDRPAPWKPQ